MKRFAGSATGLRNLTGDVCSEMNSKTDVKLTNSASACPIATVLLHIKEYVKGIHFNSCGNEGNLFIPARLRGLLRNSVARVRGEALRQGNIIRSSASGAYRFTADTRSFSYREIKRLRLERSRRHSSILYYRFLCRGKRSAARKGLPSVETLRRGDGRNHGAKQKMGREKKGARVIE